MKLSFINDSYIQRGNNGTHSGGVYKEVSGKLLTYRLLDKAKSKMGVFTVIYLENNGLVGQNIKKTKNSNAHFSSHYASPAFILCLP